MAGFEDRYSALDARKSSHMILQKKNDGKNE
jgi:hypothetical protein